LSLLDGAFSMTAHPGPVSCDLTAIDDRQSGLLFDVRTDNFFYSARDAELKKRSRA
jgi:hypothetical protein